MTIKTKTKTNQQIKTFLPHLIKAESRMVVTTGGEARERAEWGNVDQWY
jgi:hypothetical protein